MRFPLVLLISSVSLSLAAAACGSNRDVTSTTATPQQIDDMPALATVVITDGMVTSSAWDYTTKLPAMWSVSSNFIQNASTKDPTMPRYGGDAIFAPESDNSDTSSAVRANIAIVCDESDATDIDSIISEKVQLLQNLSRKNIVVDDYPNVAGHRAKKIEYAVARDDLQYEKVEVYFVTDRCVRSVALTVQPGDRARLMPQLDEVLQSFQLHEAR